MSNAKITLAPMSVVSLIAALVLAATVLGCGPAEARDRSEVTAPPVRKDRTFEPAIEIDVKLVRFGDFVITYKDEEAFEADDGGSKRKIRAAGRSPSFWGSTRGS